jgi:hypothetical protein
MRLDTSGRLLVGTSSASANGTLFLQGTNAGATNGGTIRMAAGTTSPANGAELGIIAFSDSSHSQAAFMLAKRDGGTWTSGSSMPSRLEFSTTADGASSPTERMRIKQNGEVIFDGNSASSSWASPGTIHITQRNGSSALTTEGYGDGIGFAHAVKQSGSASGGNGWAFICYNSSNSSIGGIRTSTTATSFPTSSDYRLKENIVPLTGAVNRLSQLRVYRFNFTADPDKIVDGFIAHEAQTVVPESVHGTKDEVDADGNPVYQGIDQSKLVPLLTAALQEAIGRIETLEAEVAALKGA